MKRKRLLCLGLVVLLLLPLVACSKQIETEKPVENKTRIRLAAPQNQYIEDFATNTYKLWLEEQTGYQIEMIWLPENDAERLIQLAFSTGDNLPDAYIGFENLKLFNSHNLEILADQGSIIALDTYIEEYGVNLKSCFEELQEYHFKELMTASDGHFYFMPGFSSSPITRYRQVMWVNKGWLDKLGLAVPTTTGQFYEMLMAFLTQDPNGNGLQDEIPLCGTEDAYAKQPYDYLIGSFIYNNEKHLRLLKENGVLDFAPARDEWRQALIYIESLYAQGLISPLSFTQNDQQFQQIANDPRDILGAFTSAGITRTVLQNSPEIMGRYVGIGPLEGPQGVRYSSVSIPLPKANGIITAASQNPLAVFKLFDLMLSEEACLMGRYGEQHVDWEFAKPGDISIYGTPATISILNQLWNTPQNKHLMQIGPYISRPKFSSGTTWDGTATDGEYMNAQAALLYVGYEPSEYVGALLFTPEEEKQVADIRMQLEVQVRTTMIDFITGHRDIHNDAHWLESIDEYNKLGLSEFMAAAQAASDRMN